MGQRAKDARRRAVVQADLFAPPPTPEEVAEVRGETREQGWRRRVVQTMQAAAVAAYRRLGTAVCIWDLGETWRALRQEAVAEGLPMQRAWAEQAFARRHWVHAGYAHGPTDRKDVVKTYLPVVVLTSPESAKAAGLPVPAKLRPDAAEQRPKQPPELVARQRQQARTGRPGSSER